MKTMKGFTLLEVLVAISVFSIGALGIAETFANHLRFNTKSERRSNAVAAAQQVLDELRLQDPATLPSTGTSTQTVPIGPRNYSVTTSYCPDPSQCGATLRELAVNVKLNGTTQYEVKTVFAQLR